MDYRRKIIVLVIITVFGLFLYIKFDIGFIPSDSMENSVFANDFIIINKCKNRILPYDVIIFEFPFNTNKNMLTILFKL